MRVLVVNNAAPFIRGGAEELADQLVARLNAISGVDAELLRIPFRVEPADILVEQIVLNQNLQLYQVDRVIALKFPAYLIPHPNKVLWLLHQFRQAYDLYEVGTSYLCEHPSGDRIAQLIKKADNTCFLECRAIYTNSPVTQGRLQTFNGFSSTVLYPPLLDPERFTGGEYGSYFFAGGRVGSGKRQHLLVEAMRMVKCGVRLVVAGPLDDDAYGRKLRGLIDEYDMSSRVELKLGFHGRHEIATLVNGALACVYVPVDEDSMGYVTMEAFCAAKAVLTARDSGGVLELVRDGATGMVVDPNPNSIAAGLDRLADVRVSRAMGLAARAFLNARSLSWEHTIERLLDH
jgi:glycosyltransferase involved in cell wall biosynthesis